jgi:exopolysaccharide production protein ExoQ
LSEASIVHGNSIYWVLYISITFGLYNEVTAGEPSVARHGSLPNVEVTKTAMQY